MNYTCRIEGTLMVEADNEEDARIIAEQTKESEWDWETIDVEEDL